MAEDLKLSDLKYNIAAAVFFVGISWVIFNLRNWTSHSPQPSHSMVMSTTPTRVPTALPTGNFLTPVDIKLNCVALNFRSRSLKRLRSQSPLPTTLIRASTSTSGASDSSDGGQPRRSQDGCCTNYSVHGTSLYQSFCTVFVLFVNISI